MSAGHISMGSIAQSRTSFSVMPEKPYGMSSRYERCLPSSDRSPFPADDVRQRRYRSAMLTDQDPQEKPWMKDRSNRKRYLLDKLILGCGILIGLACAAVFCYQAYAKVPRHDVCHLPLQHPYFWLTCPDIVLSHFRRRFLRRNSGSRCLGSSRPV